MWTKEAKGTPEEVQAAVTDWPNSIPKEDAGHMESVRCAVEAYVKSLPADRVVLVTASGDSSDDGTGSCTVNIADYLTQDAALIRLENDRRARNEEPALTPAEEQWVKDQFAEKGEALTEKDVQDGLKERT